MMPVQSGPRTNPPAAIGERRLLCLGGSFNPIHVGHLITAREAAESLGFPSVRLIPAAGNPHKGCHDLAPAADRLAMCRLAVEGDPFFVVDDRELRRPPPSYTIDTVTAIAGDSGIRVPWLIGTDLLPKLHNWHRFDELLTQTEFVVMRRAGHEIDLAGLDPRVARLAEEAIAVRQIEVSSSLIRERLRHGESIHGLVPPALEGWIERIQLYGRA